MKLRRPRRIRVLPLVIFALGAMLSVKLGSVWRDIDLTLTTSSLAEVKPAAGAPAPTPATKAGKEAPPPAGAPTAAGAPPPEEGPTMAGAHAPSLTSEEIAVLQKLSMRREELDKREHELELRENLLAAAEKRLDAKLDELKKVQGSVSGLLKKHDAEEEAKLAQLVKMYEVMKPKEAATIFEKLDMPVLLDVIERMREQKSGPIIAKMDPTKAEKLTTALAERRQLPKTAP
jgi:flagellar motility protein MotE (MotC chaperone)